MSRSKLSIVSKSSYILFILFILFVVFYPIILVYTIQNNTKPFHNSEAILNDIKLVIDNLEREHDAIKNAVSDIEKYSKIPKNELNKLKNEVNNLPLHKINTQKIDDHDKLQSTNNPIQNNNIISKHDNTIIKNTQNYQQANRISIETKNNNDESILIVGGTDGSGTRRVVQILVELGVTMVSEDPQTYDIHADKIGGWPVLVKDVIKSMKRLNYDINDIPANDLNKYKKSIKLLLDIAESDSHKPESKKLAVGGCLKKPLNKMATGVKYGFKAPVAMTLVPLWSDSLNKFKFLHVLRDGRDIAFSANQGPVDKFYNDMYKTDSLQREVQAIRLWSDWNSDIYDWSKNKMKISNNYDYFIIHSEDIVSDSISVRFKSIYDLAKWVKSNLSNDEICCLVLKDTKFLGSHDGSTINNVKSEKSVTSRYGKWKSIIKNNKNLYDKLHEYGKKGLEIFGYEPMRLFDDNFITSDGYQCLEEHQDKCHIKSNNVNTNDYSFDNKCSIHINTDYRGGDLDVDNTVTIENKSDCCRICLEKDECNYFTININDNLCYLKSSQGNIIANSGLSNLISGDRIR